MKGFGENWVAPLFHLWDYAGRAPATAHFLPWLFMRIIEDKYSSKGSFLSYNDQYVNVLLSPCVGLIPLKNHGCKFLFSVEICGSRPLEFPGLQYGPEAPGVTLGRAVCKHPQIAQNGAGQRSATAHRTTAWIGVMSAANLPCLRNCLAWWHFQTLSYTFHIYVLFVGDTSATLRTDIGTSVAIVWI